MYPRNCIKVSRFDLQKPSTLIPGVKYTVELSQVKPLWTEVNLVEPCWSEVKFKVESSQGKYCEVESSQAKSS